MTGVMTGFIVSSSAFADEDKTPEVVHPTEAAIALNCDTQIPGSTCPAKYSANVGLLTDTTPRTTDSNPAPSSTDK